MEFPRNSPSRDEKTDKQTTRTDQIDALVVALRFADEEKILFRLLWGARNLGTHKPFWLLRHSAISLWHATLTSRLGVLEEYIKGNGLGSFSWFLILCCNSCKTVPSIVKGALILGSDVLL